MEGEADFGITLVAKAYHADLLAAARRVGGIGKLAQLVGVSSHTLRKWLHLKGMPTITERRYASRMQKRWPRIAKVLCELTGKSVGDLFPNFVRVSGLLESEKTVEVTKQVSHGDLISFVNNQRCLPAPRSAELMIAKDHIDLAIGSLTPREQRVIEMRYGLKTGGMTLSLDECAKGLGVSRERVRQLEAEAIRKLSSNERLKLVEKAAEDLLDLNECPTCSAKVSSFVFCPTCDKIGCANCMAGKCRDCLRAVSPA